MIKSLFLALAFLTAGAASAANVVALENPPIPSTIVNVHWMHCASIGFAVDHSIRGACQVSYSSCSGRYCHSPSMFFAAAWDESGVNATQGPLCARIPASMGAAKIAYEPGYSDANCAVKYNPTGTVVYIGEYPAYYVSTDPVTGAELFNSNVQSYLYMP